MSWNMTWSFVRDEHSDQIASDTGSYPEGVLIVIRCVEMEVWRVTSCAEVLLGAFEVSQSLPQAIEVRYVWNRLILVAMS
jgi:hypothetical protein